MKKIIITMFIAGASLLTACSDAYDIEQKGFVTREDQIFNTPEDFEIGLRSVYRFFPGEEEIKFVSYFTDEDRKSTRLNSSHVKISYAVFCLKKKKKY